MVKEITLKVPDSFTDEQVVFIRKSAMLQIEAELRKTLKVRQEDIDEVDAVVNAVKESMDLSEEKPVEEIIE